MLTELEFLPSTLSLHQAYNRYVEYMEDEGELGRDVFILVVSITVIIGAAVAAWIFI